MTSMADLMSRNIPTYNPPPTNGQAPDPEDELTRMMQQQRVDQVQQARAAYARTVQEVQMAEAEAARLAAQNKVDEEKQRADEIRRARMPVPQGAADGGVTQVLGQMLNDTFSKLLEAQAGASDQVKGELAETRAMIRSLLERPTPNPIAIVKEVIELENELVKLRGGGQAAGPTPQQGWTPMQFLEWRRAELEAAREQAKSDAEIKRIEAEIEKNNDTRESVLGFLGMLGERFADEGGKQVKKVTGAEPTVERQQPQRLLRPWSCPVDQGGCGGQNMADEGQEIGYCAHCKLRVRLIAPGQHQHTEAPPPEPATVPPAS